MNDACFLCRCLFLRVLLPSDSSVFIPSLCSHFSVFGHFSFVFLLLLLLLFFLFSSFSLRPNLSGNSSRQLEPRHSNRTHFQTLVIRTVRVGTRSLSYAAVWAPVAGRRRPAARKASMRRPSLRTTRSAISTWTGPTSCRATYSASHGWSRKAASRARARTGNALHFKALFCSYSFARVLLADQLHQLAAPR